MRSVTIRTASGLIPVVQAIRHQPIATKTASERRRYIRHIATLLAMAIIFSLLYVWVRIQVIEMGYELSRIRKETADLNEQKNRLKAEVETLKAPSRLEPFAKEKFGMRFPQSNEIVYVTSSGEGASLKTR